jgi:peptide/nickel transport system substrate-binding protein
VAEVDARKVSRRSVVKTGAAIAAATPFIGAELGTNLALAQDVKDIPRNRQLILRWGGVAGRHEDYDLWSGYPVGANHQNGLGILHEPLAFYSAFADKTYPWLAEKWEYSPDFKQLTITTRSGIKWSDGEPFSAEDVAYTLDSLRQLGPKVRWGVDVQQFVESATAESDNQVIVKFKVPAPRFFYFITYKYDIGVYIVPKHIFDGQDWTTFKNFDIAKGLPVTTSPWRVVASSPEQKVIDRADSWWAVDAGLVSALPQVERVIYLPFTEEEQVAEQVISNEIDCSLDLRPLTMETILAQNPAVITHTGDQPPYGYVDWWPTSLFLNYLKAPYDDPDVRWAISHYIDRDQVIDVAYNGAGSTWPLPLPSYPGLQPFIDGVQDLLQEYPTLEFDIAKGDALLTGKGWAKNGDGIWEKDGKTLDVPIDSFQVMADIGPVIAEQLRKAGVNASFAMPPDFTNTFTDPEGDYNAALFGHGGSVSGDPYFTLRLFQTETTAVPGSHQVNFTKWKNPDYDKIVDDMYSTSPDDKDTLLTQFHQAMEIWLPALPDLPIQEWYHRIPMNTTYWSGWPTKDNAYVNGAFWHLTFQLILNELKAAQ